MKREKQVKVLTIIALIISIISLTIAYALMSSNLVINGFKSANSSDELNVYFENLTTTKTGNAVINVYPSISSDRTYIGDFEISLHSKGDSVTFCYDVVNKSKFDVELKSRLVNGLNIDTEDELTLLKSIYLSADWDGDGITTDSELLKSKQNIKISVEMPNYLESSQTQNKCTSISLESDDSSQGDIKLSFRVNNVYVQK